MRFCCNARRTSKRRETLLPRRGRDQERERPRPLSPRMRTGWSSGPAQPGASQSDTASTKPARRALIARSVRPRAEPRAKRDAIALKADEDFAMTPSRRRLIPAGAFRDTELSAKHPNFSFTGRGTVSNRRRSVTPCPNMGSTADLSMRASCQHGEPAPQRCGARPSLSNPPGKNDPSAEEAGLDFRTPLADSGGRLQSAIGAFLP